MIKIREATQEDFDTLIIFRLKLMKHDFIIDSRILYNEEKAKASAKYMKSYLKKEDNKYFIAYDGSLPIGYLHVTYDDKKNKDISYLSELYVLDIFRGFGVGKKLVLFQFKHLKKIGISQNRLTTTKYKNQRTINFYKKLNYKMVEENKKENYVGFLKEKI